MVAYTASQLLPYAEDGDEVCDSPAIIQELAERVELLIGELEDMYDSLALRPAGKMSTTPQAAYVPNSLVTFDQVEFDTTNIIDLDIDNVAIRIPALTGSAHEMWLLGDYHIITNNGLNTDMVGSILNTSPGNYPNDQRDNGGFSSGNNSILFSMDATVAEPRLTLTMSPTNSGGVPAIVNLNTAELFAFKVGDVA